jgi:hypothetical protein
MKESKSFLIYFADETCVVIIVPNSIPNAADAATTDESLKRMRSTQGRNLLSLCSLHMPAANSLPGKQGFV